ncbi:MAG TPA: HWE histidine kinase domain-containing protein [Phenylobacterium sp.]|jgi:PAS domain S-box-containing protein|nr:HWE histidine kinase domain-containing protein [Phenylobacterium sp.]
MSPSKPPGPSYEARLEAVLESVSDAFYALDTDWRYVVFNRAAEVYFGVGRKAMLGRDMWERFPQGLGTPFEGYCRAAMDQGVSTTFETTSRLRPDRVVELRIVPMRGGGVAITLTDITERKTADARQRLLVNELNHRVKNSLATVQAIAAQSLRGPDVSPEARERFMARLMALASANDVLVARTWSGATLHSVAAQMARPHGDDERFTIEGPDVHLAPPTATAMALGLHELATNAAKYGALSSPEGRVSLTWAVDGEAKARRLRLTWRESGGPAVAAPGPSGFGTRLIERGLTAELRAEVKLAFEATGVVFTLAAPLSESLREG